MVTKSAPGNLVAFAIHDSGTSCPALGFGLYTNELYRNLGLVAQGICRQNPLHLPR
jgi:hypothetical protein